jgi:hypothetical protein
VVGGSGSITPPGTTAVASGATQHYTITPVAGYRVASVLVDGASVEAATGYNFTNVQASHTISATFTPDVFTITATADVHGSISPVGVTTLNRGGSQTYTITPDPGYAVRRVVVDGQYKGGMTSYTFTDTISNHTINVYFMQITYQISTSAGTGGTITPGANTYVPGASQTYTITPAAGYHIADVLVDGTSVGAVTSYPFTNITANHTISATFALNL